MQQKRKHSWGSIFGLLLAVVTIGGISALMTRQPHAPQQPVEKQLDAKAFLEQEHP